MEESGVEDHLTDLEGRTLVDRFRVGRLLGIGGMSTVYEAQHRNGRRVALKVLRRDLAASQKARSRFLREGYVANRLGHPGAVAVLDDHVADGIVFLVMERLEGETLAQKSKRSSGPLHWMEVLTVVERVLDILSAAHGARIVHRDVKPENVFLTRDGSVKLLDFGIARVRESVTGEETFTKAGVALGTPGFMAPEQARGLSEDVDERTDVWAVGALLFRLFAGRRVHEGATANEILIASATQPAPPIVAFAPALPAPVAEIVDRALRIDKAERWQNARAMQRAVLSALGRSDSLPEEPVRVPELPLESSSPDDDDTASSSAALGDSAWSNRVEEWSREWAGRRSYRWTLASVLILLGTVVLVLGRSAVGESSRTSISAAAPVASRSSVTVAAPAEPVVNAHAVVAPIPPPSTLPLASSGRARVEQWPRLQKNAPSRAERTSISPAPPPVAAPSQTRSEPAATVSTAVAPSEDEHFLDQRM
jgi:eukaryotic-like serine/threonine-protein kinase